MANLYISNRLKAARKAAGLTQKNVYEFLGVGQSTFSAWETGVSEPPIGIFLQLCQKYGISDILGYFVPDKSSESIWDDFDPAFINKLRSLPAHGKEAVKNCVDFEYRSAKEATPPARRIRLIPFYTQAATAGMGSYVDDTDAEMCRLEAPDGADFAVRISGDSMEPMIAHGETVFVHRQNNLAPGEIGIFVFNGESYCKMWDNRGGVPKLVSLNKKYKPIIPGAGDSLFISGKVLL